MVLKSFNESTQHMVFNVALLTSTHNICVHEKHMLWALIRSALTEALLMSTHDICFHGKNRKIY